jgi:hypothetical protein
MSFLKNSCKHLQLFSFKQKHMKQLIRTMLVLFVLAVASPSMNVRANTITPTETSEQTATRLKNRLEEIKTMDVSKLSKSEKKALRGEVRAIKKELKAISGGVYLSIGAILLILLLILLLA